MQLFGGIICVYYYKHQIIRQLSEESQAFILKKVEGLEGQELEIAMIKLVMRDFYLFCERNLMIKDKDTGATIPLIFNWAQQRLVEMVLQDIQNGIPVRYIILKARQMGISTVIEAICYWWTATHKNINSAIVAHEKDASVNLYKMFRRFYDNSHPKFKPTLKYNTKNDLTFDVEDAVKQEALENNRVVPGLSSEISTMVAKEDVGRSGTNHFVHACISNDSKIVLFDGSTKTMEEVKVGDYLIAENGRKTMVVKKWATGIKRVREISLWLGNESIKVSADHKIRVARPVGKRGRRLSDPEWKTAEELTGDEWVLWPHQTTGAYIKFLTLDIYNCVYIKPLFTLIGGQRTKKPILKTDYRLGYLFGYYLAEGCVNKKISEVSFTMHKEESFYEKFVGLINCNYLVNLRKGTNTKVVVFNSAPMARLLNRFVGRTINKHIPMEWVENMPKDFLKGVYEGWKDGDGSKNIVDKCSITTIREKIARPMRQIFLTLYHRPLGISYYENRFRYGIRSQPAFIVNEYLGESKRQSKYRYVQTRNSNHGYVYIKIKDIKDSGISETFDLEVDHPSHSFLTVAGIVSNSEVGSWESSADVVSGLLQTVPLSPKTFIFLESTAKGVGNYFFYEWKAAEQGKSQFKPFFLAWHDHKEYELDESGGNLPYSDKEQKLIFGDPELEGEDPWSLKKRGYDEQAIQRKIAWRRRKAKDFIHAPEKMDQEYPDNPMAAFLSTGTYAFSIGRLLFMQDVAMKYTEKYGEKYAEVIVDRSEGKNPARDRKLQYVEVSNLRIFKEPEKGKKYVIGADVAEGIEVSVATGKEGDYSAADIMDAKTYETVAKYRGHIDPDLFGDVLFDIGMLYNSALLGVEANNHGIVTIQKLKNKFYRNLYQREPSPEEYEFEHIRTTLLGWLTNRKTKPIMIKTLGAAIRDKEIVDYDLVFIGEAMVYTSNDKGVYGNKENGHDDTVMAKAIALQLADYLSIDVDYIKDKIKKDSTNHKPQKDGHTNNGFPKNSASSIRSGRRALRAATRAKRAR